LPTGGGKSLCYQLPCLLQPSVNFIVCPIISLMLDQKDNLNSIFVNNVNYIAGNLSSSEKKIIEKNLNKVNICLFGFLLKDFR
jgi:ATP-dependent DNA helicase RecQ